MKKVFTLSENASLEYSAAICRIGEVKPIEDSDFLGKTIVFGQSLVVRKDEMKEGDIVIYCPIETVLHKDFLSANNLYEMGERDRNANFEEVQKLYDEGKVDEAKSKVGFFNKNGRIKIMRLRNTPSVGFIFKPENLLKWKPDLDLSDIESYINTQFDTIDNELFIKVYVPYTPPQPQPSGDRRLRKRNKKVKKLSRMIEGEFSFHFDTNQLNCNMHKFSPTDVVTISLKEHGTLAIFANILVKTPIQLNIAQKLLYKHIKRNCKILYQEIKKNKYRKQPLLNKLNNLKKIEPSKYTTKYGNVYASRGVIKNEFINQNVTSGFYKTDVWGEYNKLISPYVEKGMSLYGEIVGYITGSQKMIQKSFDYGCKEGENYLMIYRITTKDNNGVLKEWNVMDVEKWTKNLLKEHPELKKNVHPIKVLYHGTLADLYPEISITDHWHENVLEAMKADKIHFGMEENEPYCKNKVPREGVVIRIDNDKKAEAFKLKCLKFYEFEKKRVDKGEVDIEMEQAYSEEN